MKSKVEQQKFHSYQDKTEKSFASLTNQRQEPNLTHLISYRSRNKMTTANDQLIKAQVANVNAQTENTKASTAFTKAHTELLLAQAEEINIRNRNNPPSKRR